MASATRSRAEMKQEAIEAKQRLVEMERDEEARLKAEKTARLRELRLASEEAAKEETAVAGTAGPDSGWPWNLPQAHRR